MTCKLPEDLAARLNARARAEHRSKSAVLRELLEAGLNKTGKKKMLTAWDVAGHLCGALKDDDGVTDLATNPDHMRGFGQ